MVVQIDGTLKMAEGPAYRPHLIRMKPDTEALWTRMYYRAKSKKWNATFNQAEAYFFYENHYYPPRNLPFMPTERGDFFERVADVPRERLQ
jgi:hypothetical protein